MAAVSFSSGTDLAALRQAQANVDRATENARLLDRQAAEARRVAAQAQADADRLSADADDAQAVAMQARLRLASTGSIGTFINTTA